ncbi:MAG: aldo/keto reductase [Kiritimatiellae bacterium]|nr:aldo/keto reductase [Kiritimatiellia bacterium]
MQYRVLTGTGISVSRVCLGTMTFGRETDAATSLRMVEMALDAGVNFIDTADIYAKGQAEEILAGALTGKRDGVVLASKIRNFVGGNKIKDSGVHRWHVIRGVEASLQRLKTDCLDICYMHGPDNVTPIDETLAAFDLLVRQGKVMYVGLSNLAAWQMCEALWICDRRNWSAPVVAQVPYNLLTRSLDVEFVAFARKMRIGVTVYNPLAAGLLTGKHARDREPAPGTRFAVNKEYRGRYWTESNFEAIAQLAIIAKKAGKRMTELALQWLAAQPHVDAIVLGASRIEHLEQNLKAWQGELDAETLSACDAVWRKLGGAHFRYNR